MTCLACLRDIHEECAAPVDSLPCCCPIVLSGADIHTVLDTGGHTATLTDRPPVSTTTTNEGISLRSEKDAANVRDPESTGRKRAAKLYPIDNAQPCEWQRLANVGGGKYPIVGCLAGKQRVRHHGPDKNPLNNREGNVHRICDPCHTRWHAQNDADYDALRGHKPRMATADELIIWNVEKSYEKRNRGPGWEHLSSMAEGTFDGPSQEVEEDEEEEFVEYDETSWFPPTDEEDDD